MIRTTISSAKSKAAGYYYNDNWHGLHHQFKTLDEAKRHAIANNPELSRALASA